MKRFLAVILAAIISVAVLARPFKAFCTIQYDPRFQTVTLIVANSAVYLKDSSGEPMRFRTQVAALNYMSKLGWDLVPIPMQTESGQQQKFLFTKSVESEAAMLAEFGVK